MLEQYYKYGCYYVRGRGFVLGNLGKDIGTIREGDWTFQSQGFYIVSHPLTGRDLQEEGWGTGPGPDIYGWYSVEY